MKRKDCQKQIALKMQCLGVKCGHGLGFAFKPAMSIAIAHWEGRVSPVFDVSRHLLLAPEKGDQEELRRREVALTREGPQHRAREVAGLGVTVLLCGAVSKTLETALANAGVHVIGFLCGNVDEVLDGYYHDQLGQKRFRMPGVPGSRKEVDRKEVERVI